MADDKRGSHKSSLQYFMIPLFEPVLVLVLVYPSHISKLQDPQTCCIGLPSCWIQSTGAVYGAPETTGYDRTIPKPAGKPELF